MAGRSGKRNTEVLLKHVSKYREPGSEDAQPGGSAGKTGMKAREGGSLNRTYMT